MKENQFTYCKGLLSKFLLIAALICSVFTFTMYAGTSSSVLQKTTTELFSAKNQVIPKRVISYKYALRRIDLSTPVVCFIPGFICQSEVHDQLCTTKFKEAFKNRFDVKPMPYFISTKTVAQTLDNEVFVM